MGTVVAEMYAVDTVAVPQLSDMPDGPLDLNHFNFGDSPIPERWKQHLCEALAARRDVFSLHEWDVGLAYRVEHNIRLSDSTPFRERSCQLAPADIVDVRHHTQHWYCEGVKIPLCVTYSGSL